MPSIRGNRRVLITKNVGEGIDKNAYLTWLLEQDTLNGDLTVRWNMQDSGTTAVANPTSMNGIHYDTEKVLATGIDILYGQKYDEIPFVAQSLMMETSSLRMVQQKTTYYYRRLFIVLMILLTILLSLMPSILEILR